MGKIKIRLEHRGRDNEAVETWKNFVVETEYWHCWWCGRYQEDFPEGWFAPWLIERCHLAALPGILDRRLAILLCSRCHQAQHRQQFPRSLAIEPPTLETILWCKAVFDPEFFDWRYVQRFHVFKLPAPRPPSHSVQEEYRRRRGEYPSQRT